MTYVNSIIVFWGCELTAKTNRSRTTPVLLERLRCLERNRENPGEYDYTFAEISAIKKTAEKGVMAMVTSGE